LTRALAGILCIALVAVPVRGPARGAASSASRREVEALAERINRHRVAIGCRALVRDRRLDALALRHSEDMVRRGFFDHVNPDGRDPFDRMRAAGIRYRAAAENIAEGQETGRQTYEDWIHSPGHRRNIENCEYTHFGIGLYRSAWTLELVRYIRE
jgi:uncharacterized protein YkwD